VSSELSTGAASDAGLVSAIRSGDQAAMASLYDRYSAIVYSVALRVLRDTGAAEDVLQEVFMQLWRKPGVFDASRGNLGAWLAVIARNRSIDALRKRHSENDLEDCILSIEPDLAVMRSATVRWKRFVASWAGCLRRSARHLKWLISKE